MKLLALFGIEHSVIIDSDSNANTKRLKQHQKLHEHINTCCNDYTVSEPFLINPDLEGFLNLPTPRRDRKPLDMIMAVTESRIPSEKVDQLKSIIIGLINKK